MKDILGNELVIGDFILANDKNYSELILCKIYKFTPKSCRAIFYSKYGTNNVDDSIFTSNQIIKVNSFDNISDTIKNQIFHINNI